MASNVPTIRQISWLSFIFQLILVVLMTYLYHLASVDEAFIFGALTYSIVAFLFRNLIAKRHRQGMKLVRKQKFEEALPYFEKSVEYFSENRWVDKYRFLTLLTSSRMSYKEMGLCNIAFCYRQIGNGQKAKEYYEQVLKEFPENGLALVGLNMLKSMDNKVQLAD